MAKHRRALGVDFGTSTSLVAERMGLAPASVVPIGRTTSWLPSLAAVTDDGVVVGEDADDVSPQLVIRSIKRAITEERDLVTIPGLGREVDADEVIVAVLCEIAQRAADGGFPLTSNADVRMGCPAMWTGPQRQRLLRLAGKAGIEIDDADLVDEPIAAGIAWLRHRYLAHGETKKGRLLVFDMGGGTLDIAVLDVVGGAKPEVFVLSALGIARAGDTLDDEIARDLGRDFKSQGQDLAAQNNPELAQALVARAARRLKVLLSSVRTTQVRLDAPFDDLPLIDYPRERLENLFTAQLTEAKSLVLAALRQARLTQLQHADPSGLRALSESELCPDVDFVLLAGGMSRIPLVEDRIGSMFPNAEVHTEAGLSSDETIVAGLSDNTAYERINLHRPGFDFVLHWIESDGTEQVRVLYEAHTPFYTPVDAMTKFDVSYRGTVDARELPSTGFGRILARTTSGEYLRIDIDGDPCDGILVPFGHKDVILLMQTNGKMRIVDGRGETLAARVESWPVVRGRDHNSLSILQERVERAPVMTPWYWEKEYAPPGMR